MLFWCMQLRKCVSELASERQHRTIQSVASKNTLCLPTGNYVVEYLSFITSEYSTLPITPVVRNVVVPQILRDRFWEGLPTLAAAGLRKSFADSNSHVISCKWFLC